MKDQHSELGSPVAQVVHPYYIVSLELQDSGDGFSHNCGPQMANVHFLGYIGTGEINHNFLLGILAINLDPILDQYIDLIFEVFLMYLKEKEFLANLDFRENRGVFLRELYLQIVS